MSLQIYNTLTSRKEKFVPRERGKVSIYACGLTPQGLAHIGHLRGAVAFDAIRRWFKHRGYAVRMLQNFTDIDDKIIRNAANEGITPAALAERYAVSYLEDWNRVGLMSVEFVRVTENMDAIVRLVAELVKRGNGYVADNGDVCFSVASFPRYGRLSRRDASSTEAGARTPVDPAKRDPADFTLWKRAVKGEPSWPSPWGDGRPGWHIECSALALKHLGPAFDIHAGGIDLKFPHHENEIAQSEAACDVHPFARTWMHWGTVNRHGRKMGKSENNFLTIRDILEKYSPSVLKLYLLSTHYRGNIDYSPDRLAESARAFTRVTTALGNARQVAGWLAGTIIDDYLSRFSKAMDDDFNTAQAIGVVFEAVGDLNRALAEPVPDSGTVSSLASTIEHLLSLIGIAVIDGPIAPSELSDELIAKAIDWRKEAKTSRQFDLGDKIRDDLKSLGIILEDRPGGTTWRRE